MRFNYILSLLILGTSAANAIAVPEPADITESSDKELWRRKGGGRSGSRGGSGRSGSSSSSSSGSSSSRGGSSSSDSSRSGSSSSSSSSSSRNGQGSSGPSGSGSSRSSTPGTPGFAGAGAPRSFAGGRFYGAGASSPYKAGTRSPGGISPLLFVGAAALAFWPGVWLYGAYSYHYPYNYHFHNETANKDEDLPVICGCDPYNPCGCDANNDTTYIRDLVGDGNYNNLNQSLVTVAEVNGTKTILINGTLPNGTEPPVPEDGDSAARSRTIEALGYWPMVAAVLAAVFIA
ncbi:hypothetical protein jhhlp_001014 [Lomentospora prolificans]|uniref:DUF7732 domain-containing protein n=1 Tax=Lomentospora prolificans TaxID=41688 RepID=A0A2N3NK39_9PEZI|nr:hypothetical protein jhhlp_001014 [Lomentospora prolificans]